MALPLSLLAAGLVVYLLEDTVNLVVLAGLAMALGVVIDDVILDVGNISRRLRERRQAKDPASVGSIILESSLRVRRTVIYGSIIGVLALLPLFFIGEEGGAFLRPLAVTYSLALLASLVVALTVTPALALLVGTHLPPAPRETPAGAWIGRAYDALLPRTIAKPAPLFALAGGLIIAGAVTAPLLDDALLPAFEDPNLLIEWEAPPGTSQPAMVAIAQEASRQLRAVPGVGDVSGHVGRAILADEVVGINSGKLWVNVDPDADHRKTVTAVQAAVDRNPQLTGSVQTFLNATTDEILRDPDRDIVVRIFGHDLDQLRREAEQIQLALTQVDGLIDERVEMTAEQPQLTTRVNLEVAQRAGIKPGDVRRTAATLVGGIEVGSLFEEQKVFDVVVWGTPETRDSVDSVEKLLLDIPGGGQVRLGDVAELTLEPASSVIERDAVSRFVDVSANVRGRSPGGAVDEVERRIEALAQSQGLHVQVRSEFAELQDTRNTFLTLGIFAAILILLLFQAAFFSWRLAGLAFLTFPGALAGAALAVLADGSTISLGSVAAFLAVFAIAARHSLMLITHYRHLQQETGERVSASLVRRGAQDQLVPILTTATAVILALLPVLVWGGAAGARNPP